MKDLLIGPGVILSPNAEESESGNAGVSRKSSRSISFVNQAGEDIKNLCIVSSLLILVVHNSL
jgi:hypothetical protein